MDSSAITQAVEFLDSWLGFRARQADLPGFAVAVYCDDRMVFSRAYGFADIEQQKTLTTDHLFGVASQSKMITATAILQLVAQGKLKLDDQIVQYLPWLAKPYHPGYRHITIRQLLTHSGGLVRDGHKADYWQDGQPFPSALGLRKMVEMASLPMPPDQQMKYSNLGFALLGQVVAAASGMSYVRYVNRFIIKPLGLRHMVADCSSGLSPRIATGYMRPIDGHRSPVARQTPMRALAPVAGCFASAEAMCRFAAAHFLGDNTLLPDNLKQQAQLSRWMLKEGYDKGAEYGLGFEIQEICGRRLVGHGGSLLGYRSVTFFDPVNRLAVSVAANAKDAPTLSMLRGIFEALYHFADHTTGTNAPATARFNAILHSPLTTVQVVATGNNLAALDPNDWQPFSWADQLEQTDARTLRVSTPKSIFTEGETVRYRFARNKVAAVNYAGLSLQPLKPENTASLPRQPFMLPLGPSEALFAYYLNQHDTSFFKLEVLPDYTLLHSDGSAMVESLRAWRMGKTNKARAMIKKVSTEEASRGPWLRSFMEKPRVARTRVRIVDDHTAYTAWELECFRRIHVPIGRERIYMLPKKALRGARIPDGDLIIFDNKQIITNMYNGTELVGRTFYEIGHAAGDNYIELKQKLLRVVARKAEKL